MVKHKELTIRRTVMYKTIFAFRNGNDVSFKYEDYYKAREALLFHITGFSEDLLYAAVSYHGGEYTYTIDLADWRFGCCGEVISLGKLVSMIPKGNPSELLYGRIEEINVDITERRSRLSGGGGATCPD